MGAHSRCTSITNGPWLVSNRARNVGGACSSVTCAALGSGVRNSVSADSSRRSGDHRLIVVLTFEKRFGIRSDSPSSEHSEKNWRRERDSNPRAPFGANGFQDRRLKPLGHLSGRACRLSECNPEKHCGVRWRYQSTGTTPQAWKIDRRPAAPPRAERARRRLCCYRLDDGCGTWMLPPVSGWAPVEAGPGMAS